MKHTSLGETDEEFNISLARELTRPLHSRFSAIALISILPPELLAQIFHFHALEE